MTFAELRGDAQGLAELIATRSGRPLVSSITVPEPQEPPDELHFVRLVSWGYVLLNEAGGATFKELARLLKSGRPDLSPVFQQGRRDLDALRTAFAHNLPAESSANERTRGIAEAWLIQHGAPRDWPRCCIELQQTLRAIVGALREAFLLVCDSEGGSDNGMARMLESIDRSWPPHLFDQLVADSARDLGLPPIDAVAFRKTRQEKWAGLAGLFADRDDAALALRRVIRAEIESVFGPGKP